MKNKYLLTALFALTSFQALAFPCYLTFVKSNCWDNYTVNLSVLDATNKNVLTKVTIAPKQFWTRQVFECHAGQSLDAVATYSPKIWDNDVGKSYKMQNYIFLADNTTSAQSALEIPICFAKAFASVPIPPASSGQCKCDFKSIPVIPPKAI